MSNRVILSVLLGLVLVVLGGVFVYFKGKRHEVVITQEKIDARQEFAPPMGGQRRD